MGTWTSPAVRGARQSTLASNTHVMPLHCVVASISDDGNDALPVAGGIMLLREMESNVVYTHAEIVIPDGKAWAGGAVDVGWVRSSFHFQSAYHQQPGLPNPVPDDDMTFFGAGVTPAAARVPLLTGGPKYMADTSFNGGTQDNRGWDHTIAIKPAAAPAEGDELYLLLTYINLT